LVDMEDFIRFRGLITKGHALDVLSRTRLETSLELIVDGFRKSSTHYLPHNGHGRSGYSSDFDYARWLFG
jgi:hypothetical protein